MVNKMLDRSNHEYLRISKINNKRLELVAIRLRQEIPQLFNLMVDEYANRPGINSVSDKRNISKTILDS